MKPPLYDEWEYREVGEDRAEALAAAIRSAELFVQYGRAIPSVVIDRIVNSLGALDAAALKTLRDLKPSDTVSNAVLAATTARRSAFGMPKWAQGRI